MEEPRFAVAAGLELACPRLCDYVLVDLRAARAAVWRATRHARKPELRDMRGGPATDRPLCGSQLKCHTIPLEHTNRRAHTHCCIHRLPPASRSALTRRHPVVLRVRIGQLMSDLSDDKELS